MSFQYVLGLTKVGSILLAGSRMSQNKLHFPDIFFFWLQKNGQEGCASVLPAMTKQTLMGVPEVTLGRHGQNVLLFPSRC